MAIKRYIANADNTITNAFDASLNGSFRATGSNMGESDILEAFSIYGQASGSTGQASELSRVLIKFPVDTIITDRDASTIPASGSVSFFLRMYNAKHGETLPRNYTLVVAPVSQSWEEGYGLDMVNYTDKTYDGFGSNWLMRASGSAWLGAKATLADAIDITGHANGDKFTMTVPAAAGGDGVAYTFLLDSTTNINNDTGANTFGISRQIPSDDAATALAIIDAVNGTANAAVKYGNADTGAGSTLSAGTIGLTAAVGSSSSKITLTMDDPGPDGNVASVLAAVTGFETDLLLESTFTGGSNTIGGNYHDSPRFEQTLDRGHEDLEIDITHLVEQWIGGENNGTGNTNTRKLNYGVGVFFTSSQEAYTQQTITNKSLQNLTGAVRSYYTKRFFARGSEFFFKRPCVEARWDSSRKDKGGKFKYWSPLTENADNINTIYFYNYVNGQLKNIPSSYLTDNKIFVSLYSGSYSNIRPKGSALKLKSSSYSALGVIPVAATNDLNATGGLTTTTGIYSCSLALTGADSGSLTNLFAVWHNKNRSSAGAFAATNYAGYEFHTSSLIPDNRKPSNVFPPGNRYITSIPSLRNSYHKDETARFRIHTRQKNWNPNIYTKASSAPELSHIENTYFKVSRIADKMTVIDYGTGSATAPQDTGTAASCTRLSYDVSGSYFDLDMNLLEPGYAYGIKFVYYLNNSYMEQPEEFKFRVEDT